MLVTVRTTGPLWPTNESQLEVTLTDIFSPTRRMCGLLENGDAR